MRRKAAILFASIVVAMGGNSYTQDLESYEKTYQDALLALAITHSEQVNSAKEMYSANLGTLKQRTQAAGDLDRTMAVSVEIDRFGKNRTLLAAEGKLIPEIEAALKDCLAKITQADMTKEQGIVTLTVQYDKALLRLQKELTRKGEFDKAIVIRNERKALAESDPLTDARLLPVETSAKNAMHTAPVDANNVVYLSDLQEFDVHVGHGSFGKKGDLGYEDKKIVVDGKPSKEGLSLHPPTRGSSRVSYVLAGKYRWFYARSALNDGIPKRLGPVAFTVIGDDKVLWKSRLVRLRGYSEDVEVDVRGVEELRLEVSCPGRSTHAHAVWIDPQLRK